MAVYFVGGAKLVKDIKSINAEIEILRSMEFGGVGRIEKYAASTPPQNTIKANGATLSRTTFARLWEYAQASGNLVDQTSKDKGNFGTGDGSTTFTIPDLRGEFVRGLDDGSGIDTGRGIGSLQMDQMQKITGQIQRLTSSSQSSSGALRLTDIGREDGGGGGARRLARINFDSSNSPNARTGDETRSRNIALMFCIRYQ